MGNLFSSQSHGFPSSWVPLPINYFQEDVHLWEMLPPTIPPSGYLSWLLCDPSLICSFMYVPIYSKYIRFVKCAVPNNANKNKIKIWVDSLHESLFIPLKTAQFLVQLSLEFMLYEECCRGATNHVTGICRQRQVNRKLGIAGPLFSFSINYITEIT